MFKQHIQNMSGIQDGYLVFSLIVFFIGIVWWTFTADKKYLKDMEEKPFEN